MIARFSACWDIKSKILLMDENELNCLKYYMKWLHSLMIMFNDTLCKKITFYFINNYIIIFWRMSLIISMKRSHLKHFWNSLKYVFKDFNDVYGEIQNQNNLLKNVFNNIYEKKSLKIMLTRLEIFNFVIHKIFFWCSIKEVIKNI